MRDHHCLKHCQIVVERDSHRRVVTVTGTVAKAFSTPTDCLFLFQSRTGFPMKFVTSVAVISLLTIAASGTAYADGCSGRDHSTGTVVGAVGGAAIGGVATHNVGGAVAGGVIGGLAGNAIARSDDCNRQVDDRQGYEGRGGDRPGYNGVYLQGNQGRDNESDYWGVESYEDFSSDYRHIADSIQRGREHGFYGSDQARGYFQQLQQIRSRADWQQRNGRFDPEDIEMHLTRLRESMHAAREYRQGRDDQDYRR